MKNDLSVLQELREKTLLPIILHVIPGKYNWFLHYNDPDTTTKETTLSMTVREVTS